MTGATGWRRCSQQLGLYECSRTRSHGGELPRLRDSVKRLTNAARRAQRHFGHGAHQPAGHGRQLAPAAAAAAHLSRRVPLVPAGPHLPARLRRAQRACCAAGNGPGCPIIPRCWPSWNCREARAGQAGLDGWQRHPAIAERRGLLPSLCAAIDAATVSVHLETYIFMLDRSGEMVLRCGRSRFAASRWWCWTVSAAPPPPTRSESGSRTLAPNAASSGPSRAGSPS